MRKKLLRFLRLAPVALLFASVAMAQTTGTIIGVVTDASTGKPVAGAVVVATSPNLQGEQTAVTGKDGSYRITLLPTGQYKLSVQVAGYQAGQRGDIRLGLDKTLRANLSVVPEAVTLEEQVVRTGTQAPVVNVGSAEAGTVVTKEFIASVPIRGRTIASVMTTVPTAQNDLMGVSIAGAQSSEISYLVDGMSVNDAQYGALLGNPASLFQQGTNLLPNFTEQYDIKSGSMNAEWGRTMGGAVSIATKSGSNEFHGSVFSSLAPNWLTQLDGQVLRRNGEAIAVQNRPSKGAYSLDYGVEVGGPILKDRLWFYAGFAPRVDRTVAQKTFLSNVVGTTVTGSDPRDTRVKSGSTFLQNEIGGSAKDYKSDITRYQMVGKLTFLANENHSVSLGGIAEPSKTKDLYYGNFGATIGRGDDSSGVGGIADQEGLTADVILKYNGKLLNKKLNIEALGGLHHSESKPLFRNINGVDQGSTPSIRWNYFHNLAEFNDIPGGACGDKNNPADVFRCPTTNYFTGGYDAWENPKSDRWTGRLAVSYLAELAGQHTFKAGVDYEATTFANKKSWAPYRFFAQNPFNPANPVDAWSINRAYGYVNTPTLTSNSRADVQLVDSYTAKGTNAATSLFIQDSYLIANQLTINVGLRWDGQALDSGNAGATKVHINDNFAPRAQAIWDFTKQGRGKLGASWGRFFEAIPLRITERTLAGEPGFRGILQGGTGGGCRSSANGFTGAYDPYTAGCPGWKDNQGNLVDANGVPVAFLAQNPIPTPIQPGLKGQYVDQFGAQMQYELISDLSIGLEYQGRRLGTVIEDLSSNDAASYYIGNPGSGKTVTYFDPGAQQTFTVSTDYGPAIDRLTGRVTRADFPKPERAYDALTFSVNKAFSRNWQASAAYTYSSLRGNFDGLTSTSNGQVDPNITSTYDIPALMANRYGPLRYDRPHEIKVSGSYTWQVGTRLSITGGGLYTGRSGIPIDVLVPYDENYGAGEGYLLPRGSGGRTPWTNQVDLRGSVEYVIVAPYTVKFSVDVLNALSSEEVTAVDNNYFNASSTGIPLIVNGRCNAYNSASATDKTGALQANCPDLKYARNLAGRLVVPNANWGQPTAFQLARSMRLALSLNF